MFCSRSAPFATRWRRLRREQLVRIDIANETAIRDLDQLDALVEILSQRSGRQIVYSSLASDVQTNEVTVRQWLLTLNSFFYGFAVRPWFRNVANSIRKTPKWYLRDWSGIRDPGTRNETMVACHLLKAVETWTDMGFGDYGLYYLRDKNKNEVDFLMHRAYAELSKPAALMEIGTMNKALLSLTIALVAFVSSPGSGVPRPSRTPTPSIPDGTTCFPWDRHASAGSRPR